MATNLRLTLWGFLSSSIGEKEIGAGKMPHVSLWGFPKVSSIEEKGLGAGNLSQVATCLYEDFHK